MLMEPLRPVSKDTDFLQCTQALDHACAGKGSWQAPTCLSVRIVCTQCVWVSWGDVDSLTGCCWQNRSVKLVSNQMTSAQHSCSSSTACSNHR